MFHELDSAVEQVKAATDTPWARSRRDRFARVANDLSGDGRSARPDPHDDTPVELSERQRPTPSKRRFECPNCERRFVTDVYARSWIECRSCLVQPQPVCRSCEKTVAKVVNVGGWRCRECEDYHAVAVDSAGPGGNRSLGPLRQSKRGKRYTGPA